MSLRNFRHVAKGVIVAMGLGLVGCQTLAVAGSADLGREKAAKLTVVRTAKSGFWSVPATWEGGTVPAAGAIVQIRTGHTVTYDLKSDQAFRAVHVAGTLTFARNRDTRLDVGLIKIQPGDVTSEDGFDCDAHAELKPGQPRPVLEVGTPDQPMPAVYTALIRL